jgi:hypothetical protein
MVWYGIEALAESNPDALADLGTVCQLPLTRRCLSRRLMQERESPAHTAALATILATAARDSRGQADILEGLLDALKGQRNLPATGGWATAAPAFAANPDAKVQTTFRALGAIFADPLASDALRATVRNASLPVAERRGALRSLIETRANRLTELCEAVLITPGISSTAADGLALDPDPAIVDRIVNHWPAIAAAERGAVLGTILSRRAWADRIKEFQLQRRAETGEIRPC